MKLDQSKSPRGPQPQKKSNSKSKILLKKKKNFPVQGERSDLRDPYNLTVACFFFLSMCFSLCVFASDFLVARENFSNRKSFPRPSGNIQVLIRIFEGNIAGELIDPELGFSTVEMTDQP